MSSDTKTAAPVSNSNAKCLLSNWVEERAVAGIDAPEDVDSGKTKAKTLKHGHDGLMTTNFGRPMDSLTTMIDHYRTPELPGVPTRGDKEQEMERALWIAAREQLAAEQAARKKDIEYNPDEGKSTYQLDHVIEGFVSKKPAPTTHHDLHTEQPATIWTDLKQKAHGVSQIKPTFDTPFRKNGAFTDPFGTYDHPPPHELQSVPNM